MNFVDMMLNQKDFNEEKFGISVDVEEKRQITKDLALNSYTAINKMIEKMRKSEGEPSEDDLIFSSIDILRYIMSMLNLWDINPEKVDQAFALKDNYLRLSLEVKRKQWEGQPVAIVDMDDVLCCFRDKFCNFLNSTYQANVDRNSKQYYFIEAVKDIGLNPEKVFEDFIQLGSFRNLAPEPGALQFLTDLKSKGYWIQILTARPKENLTVFYDTYAWLKKHNVPFDRVDFSPEKLRWCMSSEYYDSSSIAFALDDSPKHASEYASHDIPVYVPLKSYNEDLDLNNITFYTQFSKLGEEIE